MTIRGVIPPEYQNVTDTNVGKMMEKDAIHEIEMMEQMECACPDCERRRPALQMAIEALRFQHNFVNCKDCGRWRKDGLCWWWSKVDLISYYTQSFDGCSFGERRDEE